MEDEPVVHNLTIDDIQAHEDNTQVLLLLRSLDTKSYLNSLLDYYIILYLFNNNNYDDIKDDLPFYLTFLFLNGHKPQSYTIRQNLYDYNYNQITYPTFTHQFNDPLFPDSYYKTVILTNFAKQTALKESQMQYDYLETCREYLIALNQNAKIDQTAFLDIIRKNPTISRQEAIRNSLENKKYPTLNGRRPRMDINQLLDDTTRYINQLAEFESVKYANENAKQLGKKPPYQTKTWIWSGKKHTRHRGMDGQTVPVNEPFIVTNEMNGQTVKLMFPRDYVRDASGSNTVNCGCSVVYGKK